MGIRARLVTPVRQWVCRRRGSFPYFGCRVFFPPNSLLFERTFGHGVFEPRNVQLLTSFARKGGTILDVGANIGLLSLPLLSAHPDLQVVSYEPSPNSLPFLEKTRAQSAHAARWEIVGKALSDREGQIEFHISSPDLGAYDGPADTGRAGPMRQILVQATTLDAEWERLGRPRLSAIKLDVEGSELRVLRGGARCLTAHQPPVLLEVHRGNVEANGLDCSDVLRIAAARGYGTYALPGLVRIGTPRELALHLLMTEDFVLWPLTRPITRVADACADTGRHGP
jgi:FkbM family methyltransferase